MPLLLIGDHVKIISSLKSNPDRRWKKLRGAFSPSHQQSGNFARRWCERALPRLSAHGGVAKTRILNYESGLKLSTIFQKRRRVPWRYFDIWCSTGLSHLWVPAVVWWPGIRTLLLTSILRNNAITVDDRSYEDVIKMLQANDRGHKSPTYWSKCPLHFMKYSSFQQPPFKRNVS